MLYNHAKVYTTVNNMKTTVVHKGIFHLIPLCLEHQLYDYSTGQEYSYNVMSNQ